MFALTVLQRRAQKMRLETSGGHQTLTNSLVLKLDSVLPHGQPPTIHRTPDPLREVEPLSYEPKVISIGPYHHHSKPCVRFTNFCKLRYLKDFIARDARNSLGHYVELVQNLEARARRSYSEEVLLGSDQFNEIMLLDGCFILELFLKSAEDQTSTLDDPIYGNRWLRKYVCSDLLYLENQIPFFVLEQIYDLQNGHKQISSPLVAMAMNFFNLRMRWNPSHILTLEPTYVHVYHLLHLVHSHHVPEIQPPLLPKSSIFCLPFSFLAQTFGLKGTTPSRDGGSDYLPRKLPYRRGFPSVTSLKEAGVKFSKRQLEHDNNILNIRFTNGLMEIPHISVEDSTIFLLRNMVAMEQCCDAVAPYFTHYAEFMDFLVNTKKDVEILHENGILVSGMGSDEDVAHLFNRMCKGVVISSHGNYLCNVKKDVNDYCAVRIHAWRAKLIHDYFSNPWAILSLVAAVVLLLLTVAQTVFAVLPYYSPPS